MYGVTDNSYFYFEVDAFPEEMLPSNWEGYQAYRFYASQVEMCKTSLNACYDALRDTLLPALRDLITNVNAGNISEFQFSASFQNILLHSDTLISNVKKNVDNLYGDALFVNGTTTLLNTQLLNDQINFEQFFRTCGLQSNETLAQALTRTSNNTHLKAAIESVFGTDTTVYNNFTIEELQLKVYSVDRFASLSPAAKACLIAAYYGADVISQQTFPAVIEGTEVINGESVSVNRAIPSMPYSATDKAKGAMQPFYLSYIIEKENPLNAFASFLEIKSKALNAAIALMSRQMEYYSAYMEVLNQGLRAINSNTNYNASGKSDTGKDTIPIEAIVIAAYFLRHEPRLVTDPDGKTYFLLQYDDAADDGKSGESRTYPGQYILVPADANSLSAFVNTVVENSDAKANEGSHNDNKLYVWSPHEEPNAGRTISTGLEYANSNSIASTQPATYTILHLTEDSESCVKTSTFQDSSGAIQFDKYTSFNIDGTGTYTVQMMKPTPLGYPSSSNGLPTFGFDYAQVDNHSDNPFKGETRGVASDTAAQWNWSGSINMDKVTSFTQTFQSRIQSIDTEVQRLQNELSSNKGKIDTFDMSASSFRKKAQDVSQQPIEKIAR
jgi:prefoldin subunit 5